VRARAFYRKDEIPSISAGVGGSVGEDRRALTEMLVDNIVVAPHPHKIVDGRRHSPAPSHTKIPRWRPSGSRRCTRLGSRSSQGLSSRSVTEAERHLNDAQLRSSSRGARNQEAHFCVPLVSSTTNGLWHRDSQRTCCCKGWRTLEHRSNEGNSLTLPSPSKVEFPVRDRFALGASPKT
jgi:hypothetical protein